MSPHLRPALASLMVTCLLIAASMFLTTCRADDPEMVPEPWVHETHEFNVPVDTSDPNTDMCNEKWSLEVRHGEVLTLLMAREMAQDSGPTVDYTFNIHYNVNGTQYIAQFMIMYVAFKVGDHTIEAPLTNCDGFSLTSTPIHYIGGVPSFYCNITYEGIQVYPSTYPDSTVDLTLCHHITADWDRTGIKVEALFDFADTTFFESFSDTELAAGSQFTAEIHYGMMVHKAHAFGTEGALMPTGHTNDSLLYSLTLDNGAPLTFSKLQMEDQFSITNSTGIYGSLGYSSMDFSATSHVVHGFPGLVYKDTMSMKSDPEITVYHDRVTAEQNGLDSITGATSMLLPIAAIGAVAVIGLAIVMVMRKRRER